MKVINTINDILNLAGNYKNKSDDYLVLWESYIKDLPHIRQLCYEDMLDHKQMDYVYRDANYALTHGLDKLKLASDNFDKAISEIGLHFNSFCPCGNQITIYFYMGLSNAAGWATSIGEEGAILIGGGESACSRLA